MPWVVAGAGSGARLEVLLGGSDGLEPSDLASLPVPLGPVATGGGPEGGLAADGAVA